MSLMNSLNVSASGMSAQRTRMDIIAQNIANVNTTRTEDGSPYYRQTVTMAESDNSASFADLLNAKRANLSINKSLGNGVKITGIVEDHVTALKEVYDPSHPDADEEGYVTYSNVDTVTE